MGVAGLTTVAVVALAPGTALAFDDPVPAAGRGVAEVVDNPVRGATDLVGEATRGPDRPREDPGRGEPADDVDQGTNGNGENRTPGTAGRAGSGNSGESPEGRGPGTDDAGAPEPARGGSSPTDPPPDPDDRPSDRPPPVEAAPSGGAKGGQTTSGSSSGGGRTAAPPSDPGLDNSRASGGQPATVSDSGSGGGGSTSNGGPAPDTGGGASAARSAGTVDAPTGPPAATTRTDDVHADEGAERALQGPVVLEEPPANGVRGSLAVGAPGLPIAAASNGTAPTSTDLRDDRAAASTGGVMLSRASDPWAGLTVVLVLLGLAAALGFLQRGATRALPTGHAAAVTPTVPPEAAEPLPHPPVRRAATPAAPLAESLAYPEPPPAIRSFGHHDPSEPRGGRPFTTSARLEARMAAAWLGALPVVAAIAGLLIDLPWSGPVDSPVVAAFGIGIAALLTVRGVRWLDGLASSQPPWPVRDRAREMRCLEQVADLLEQARQDVVRGVGLADALERATRAVDVDVEAEQVPATPWIAGIVGRHRAEGVPHLQLLAEAVQEVEQLRSAGADDDIAVIRVAALVPFLVCILPATVLLLVVLG